MSKKLEPESSVGLARAAANVVKGLDSITRTLRKLSDEDYVELEGLEGIVKLLEDAKNPVIEPLSELARALDPKVYFEGLVYPESNLSEEDKDT